MWFSGQCTGSLIAPRYVLTTAHCVHRKLEVATLGFNTVVKVVKVRKAVIHPTYTLTNLSHDVAVLELDEDVALPHMPRLYDRPNFSAKKLTVLGYGFTRVLDNRGRPQTSVEDGKLRRVDLPVLPESVCMARYRSFKAQCERTRCICAGGTTEGVLNVSVAMGFPGTSHSNLF